MFLKMYLPLKYKLDCFLNRVFKFKKMIVGKLNVVKVTMAVLFLEPMVAIEFSGDLGSQLFQWAAARSMFKNRNIKFCAEVSDFNFFKRYKFCINEVGIEITSPSAGVFIKKLSDYWSPFLECISLSRWPYKVLEGSLRNSKEVSKRSHYLVAGYWREPSFAENAREELALDIRFPPLPAELSVVLMNICQKPVFVCSDQAWVQNQDIIEWHRRALEISPIDEAFFLRLRAESKLESNKVIDLSAYTQAVQLQFISKLNFVILSPSLIGWWGAWLNRSTEKKVYYPRDWNLLSGKASRYYVEAWKAY